MAGIGDGLDVLAVGDGGGLGGRGGGGSTGEDPLCGGNRAGVQDGRRDSGAPIDIFHCTTNLSRNQFNWAQIFTLR